MALTVNTNVASLTAQRNLTGSQSSLATSLERLSSGLRINSAKDDAAGLAISERFSAQIRGLNQGVRNANDGISLSQTAEGALAEVTNNLQRIRELAVQSANSTNSTSDRNTLQSEVAQLVAEIDRVSNNTKFNNISLLDGTFTAQTFQVGANSGETIAVASIVDSRTQTIGANTLVLNGTDTNVIETAAATAVTSAMTAQTFTVTSANGGSATTAAGAVDASAGELATLINTATAAAGNGVTATAENVAYISQISAGGTVGFTLATRNSGGEIGSAAISATVTTTDLSALVQDINSESGTTGVTAEAITMDDGSTTGIKLTSTNAADIQITNYANTGDGGATLEIGKTSDQGSTTTLTDGDTTGTNTDSTIVYGKVTLSSTSGAITVTEAASSTVAVNSATNSFSSVSSVNIGTSAGASAALSVIDAALDVVNAGRGELGALQNRFESVVRSSQVAAENLSSSRSRILDADFAAETAALTKSQILQQSGIAMLAQANSIPQNVLALLQ